MTYGIDKEILLMGINEMVKKKKKEKKYHIWT